MKQPEPGPVLRGKAIVDAVNAYALNKAKADKLNEDNAALKDVILAAVGAAPVSYVGTHIVRVTETAGAYSVENWTITAKMVGQVVAGSKGRAGSVKLEVI